MVRYKLIDRAVVPADADETDWPEVEPEQELLRTEVGSLLVRTVFHPCPSIQHVGPDGEFLLFETLILDFDGPLAHQDGRGASFDDAEARHARFVGVLRAVQADLAAAPAALLIDQATRRTIGAVRTLAALNPIDMLHRARAMRSPNGLLAHNAQLARQGVLVDVPGRPLRAEYTLENHGGGVGKRHLRLTVRQYEAPPERHEIRALMAAFSFDPNVVTEVAAPVRTAPDGGWRVEITQETVFRDQASVVSAGLRAASATDSARRSIP